MKNLRNQHKNVIFARIYGGGPKRIQALLNEYLVNHVPAEKRYEVCEEISKALDKATPLLSKYLKAKIDEVRKNGFVQATKFGRRRYFDEPEKAFGDAMNYDIQSSGSAAIKIALINIDKWIMKMAKEFNIPEDEFGWLSMSIYDQNLVCLNDKYLAYAHQVQELMAEALTSLLFDLKGNSDCNIRKFWSKN